MSTHAMIWCKFGENDYRGAYNHFDGYIYEGLGETLLKFWNNEPSIQDLVSNGDIRSVRERYVDLYSNYENRKNEHVQYRSSTRDDIVGKGNAEYFYLFEDGKWKIWSAIPSDGKVSEWVDLETCWRILAKENN